MKKKLKKFLTFKITPQTAIVSCGVIINYILSLNPLSHNPDGNIVFGLLLE